MVAKCGLLIAAKPARMVTNFAQLLTADHKIVGERNPEHEPKDQDRVALVILDCATRYLVAYPAKSRGTHEVKDAFIKFLGLETVPTAVYSDNAGEITAAVKELNGTPVTCTPHVPQTNGAAENSIRKVTEGTSCALVQSGLSYQWWNWATSCFCFLRNTNDLQAGGGTPYFRCPGEHPKCLQIPCGARVDYMKFDCSGKALRDSPFDRKTHAGIFAGYDLRPGGQWSDD